MGNKTGRPLKYETPEEMQKDIDSYFDSVKYEYEGREIFRPTVEGLAYALDMTRKSLIRYGERDEFSHTVKRAKQKVAMALENHLWGTAVTGAIFNLKNNFGWVDKQEVESVNIHKVVDYTELSDAELDELIKES